MWPAGLQSLWRKGVFGVWTFILDWLAQSHPDYQEAIVSQTSGLFIHNLRDQCVIVTWCPDDWSTQDRGHEKVIVT